MASHSILASAPATAELLSPSQATSRLHKLTGHSLGHRAPVQGDQMDYIIPVLPAGVHLKWLWGKNGDALHRWTWLLLSFCQKNWTKLSVSTIWRAGCSLELLFYPLQLITGSFSHHLAPPSSCFQRTHITPSSYSIIRGNLTQEQMLCSEGCLLGFLTAATILTSVGPLKWWVPSSICKQ